MDEHSAVQGAVPADFLLQHGKFHIGGVPGNTTNLLSCYHFSSCLLSCYLNYFTSRANVDEILTCDYYCIVNVRALLYCSPPIPLPYSLPSSPLLLSPPSLFTPLPSPPHLFTPLFSPLIFSPSLIHSPPLPTYSLPSSPLLFSPPSLFTPLPSPLIHSPLLPSYLLPLPYSLPSPPLPTYSLPSSPLLFSPPPLFTPLFSLLIHSPLLPSYSLPSPPHLFTPLFSPLIFSPSLIHSPLPYSLSSPPPLIYFPHSPPLRWSLYPPLLPTICFLSFSFLLYSE